MGASSVVNFGPLGAVRVAAGGKRGARRVTAAAGAPPLQRVVGRGAALLARRRVRACGRAAVVVTASEGEDSGSKKAKSTLDALEAMGIVEPVKERKNPYEERRREKEEKQGTPAAAPAAAAPPAPPPADTTTPDKKPLSALDSMLGVAPEEAKTAPGDATETKEGKTKEGETKDTAPVSLSVSDDVIKQIMEAEASRTGKELEPEEAKKVKAVFESVQNLSNDNKDVTPEDAEKLQAEFENLVKMLAPESIISKEDIDIMKNKVFGFNTFWVTGNEPYLEMEGGWVFRGNLRAPRTEVYASVEAQMASEFGDKYELLMVEERIDGDTSDDGRGGPRVSFVIVPTALSEPQPTTTLQIGIAALLSGFTVVTAIQTGLVAEITRLPPEMVTWFSDPENVNSGILPPGFEDFDPIAYFDHAMPITMGILAAAGTHELGHIAAGLLRDVKLSPPFFIPNGQLGTFGAITQIKSRVRDRSQLFDVAAAGPYAGGAVGLGLFVYGLAMTLASGGDAAAAADLVPVPAGLLQGSLLLGGITQIALGVDAGRAALVPVHPYLVAGWCVLTTTALNLLPVGSLDGGRMAQAAFGRRALGFTGILTYLGLSLGLVGGALSLPFGLYLLLTQRSAERPPRDDVSEVGSTRNTLALAAIFFAVMVLLPLGVDTTDPMLNGTPML